MRASPVFACLTFAFKSHRDPPKLLAYATSPPTNSRFGSPLLEQCDVTLTWRRLFPQSQFQPSIRSRSWRSLWPFGFKESGHRIWCRSSSERTCCVGNIRTFTSNIHFSNAQEGNLFNLIFLGPSFNVTEQTYNALWEGQLSDYLPAGANKTMLQELYAPIVDGHVCATYHNHTLTTANRVTTLQ